ncbi:MAG: laccase domain-containing protein, partial [Acidimicrobiia bacterium]|nr:laccase domain-containing protein [Acidimicrobiia bacterium]
MTPLISPTGCRIRGTSKGPANMIRPPGFRGAAFTTAASGDMKNPDNRRRVSDEMGIPSDWAFVRQVHGHQVHIVTESGSAGPGDALVTTTGRLPLAVNVADCAGLVIETASAVAVVHAGWRGVVAGVAVSAG